jgi:sugar-specific transcriptional regulator TrmB
MTDKEVIQMAKEAGWEMDDSCVLEPQVVWYISQGQLERFAALVATAEREACVKVCDSYDVAEDINSCDTAEGIAIAIRERGNNET